MDAWKPSCCPSTPIYIYNGGGPPVLGSALSEEISGLEWRPLATTLVLLIVLQVALGRDKRKKYAVETCSAYLDQMRQVLQQFAES